MEKKLMDIKDYQIEGILIKILIVILKVKIIKQSKKIATQKNLKMKKKTMIQD